MPIYDYLCKQCGHEWEVEQRITEDPIKKCPTCGALEAKRLISKTSFVLKGGGWYNDLYSSAGDTSKSDAGSADGDSSAGSSASDKSEKKPAKPDGDKKKPKGKSKKKSAA